MLKQEEGILYVQEGLTQPIGTELKCYKFGQDFLKIPYDGVELHIWGGGGAGVGEIPSGA